MSKKIVKLGCFFFLCYCIYDLYNNYGNLYKKYKLQEEDLDMLYDLIYNKNSCNNL